MAIIFLFLAICITYGLVKGWNDGSSSIFEKPLWFYFLAGIAFWWVMYGTLSKNGDQDMKESWSRIWTDANYFFEFGITNSLIFGALALILILVIRGIKSGK